MKRLFDSGNSGSSSLISDYMAAHPGEFGSYVACSRYLSLILFPPSRRWRYQLNGKSGNTFVLNLLFEIEYGCRFTSRVDPAHTGNQHPDLAIFQLPQSSLFSTALASSNDASDIDNFPGVSIATVRDPWTRILSAFFYLCRSHTVGDRRFLAERIRLNALCKFDWDKETNTTVGFEKFIDYIGIVIEELGFDGLDAHWLPQVCHIRPNIYHPKLVGRTEDLASFADALQDYLNVDVKIPLSRLRLNKNENVRLGFSDFFSSERVVAKILKIYRDDFDVFEYSSKAPA